MVKGESENQRGHGKTHWKKTCRWWLRIGVMRERLPVIMPEGDNSSPSALPSALLGMRGTKSRQESRAIAKLTVQCAVYMDALKNFGSPGLCPRLLFPKLLMGFCCNRSCESAYKFFLKFIALPIPEIGVHKKFGQSLDISTLPFLQNF